MIALLVVFVGIGLVIGIIVSLVVAHLMTKPLAVLDDKLKAIPGYVAMFEKAYSVYLRV